MDVDKKHILSVSNCNNILAGEISICPEQLNIKYANNGTGKSTIARAIRLTSEKKPLASLTPFAHLAKGDRSKKPQVSPMPFERVMVFDTEYLNQYVYQKSDLLKDTFEVLIRNSEYDSHKASVDSTLENIRALVKDKPDVAQLRQVLASLCGLIELTGAGKLDRRKAGVKSLLGGKGALFQAPESLKEFEPFFADIVGGTWVEWKFRGIKEFGDKGLCPYCADPETEPKRRQTELFQSSFDEACVTFTTKLREHLLDMSDYIDDSGLERLLSLLGCGSDKAELEALLIKFAAEVAYLRKKLDALALADGYSIEQSNMGEFEGQFVGMKIDANLIKDFFSTSKTRELIGTINDHIDDLVLMIGKLKGETARFSRFLQQQIQSRKSDIDSFLQTAGFNYAFDVVVAGDNNAHAVLSYCVPEGLHEVKQVDRHLSWGEKNAFALILFMFDAISKDADLIILDDPISSFDSSKKYAIINRLFKTGDKNNSLYQRTVLLLTHDFEPVIDYIQVGGKLSKDSVNAYYLENNGGQLVEHRISKNRDMMSMVVLMKEIAQSDDVPLPVRVGCLRKYIEHVVKNPKEESIAYNILSSLVHCREWPTYDSAGVNKIALNEYQSAMDEIAASIDGFCYESALAEFSAERLLDAFQGETNAFFQLLILRAYTESSADARDRLKRQNDVLRKYIDETYHIENDYLYSLDVRRFNIVPEYYRRLANNFVASEITGTGVQ